MLFKNIAPLLQKSLFSRLWLLLLGFFRAVLCCCHAGIFCWMLAGVYPHWFSPPPILFRLLKQLYQQIKGHALRKILTELQFVITIVLIISFWTVVNQVNYLKTKDLGYNTEQVIVCKRIHIWRSYEDIKEDFCWNIRQSLDLPIPNTRLSRSTWRNSIYFEGQQEDTKMDRTYMTVDYNIMNFIIWGSFRAELLRIIFG